MIFNANTTRTTLCTIPRLTHIVKRGMLSSKSVQVARAAYYCLNSLTNPQVMDKTSKNSQTTLAESLVDLSLDHTKGVVQHKTTILKHISNHRFASDDFYAYYRTYNPKFKWEPNTHTDIRILNELPIIHEYSTKFDYNIDWVLATADSRAASFPHQIQSNQDFWVNVMTKVDKSMGLGTHKVVPQDEKSGMDMFKHSTRGSLGLLTYDQQSTNVQITNKPILITDLIPYNRRRLHSINAGLDSDKVDYPYKPILDKCEAYLNNKNKSIYEIHNNIQDELWTGLQCHPLYNRSISFIFIKQVVYSPLTETEDAFRNHFVSLLGDKMYDLNSRQDCRDVYKAMLIAYKTQVDSKVIDKLYHLHHQAGITLNTHFLHDMANLIKHGLL
jgi:hypothetical protein